MSGPPYEVSEEAFESIRDWLAAHVGVYVMAYHGHSDQLDPSVLTTIESDIRAATLDGYREAF